MKPLKKMKYLKIFENFTVRKNSTLAKLFLTLFFIFSTILFVFFNNIKFISAQIRPFAVVCIGNETNQRISFGYKWGDKSSYRTISLNPGEYRWFSYRYRSIPVSPNFRIIFDYDLRPGRREYKYYNLERNQARFQDCSYGKQYYFRKIGRSFIDLYDY